MKKILIIAVVAFNCFFSMTSFAKNDEQSLDQMVAVVNDDLITRSELNDAIKALKMQMEAANVAEPPKQALEKQVLNQLINKKLQLQLAAQNGIKTSTKELDEAVKKIAAQNGVSVKELYQRVQQQGYTKVSYRKELSEQITMQKLQADRVAKKVTISPQEVSAYMKSAFFQKNSDKEYRIHDILIPTPDNPSKAELSAARARADRVLDKLHEGTEFSAIAKLESKGKNALQGGDLGWRKLPEIPSAFADVIVDMKKHDIAGPIQAPNGLHILYMSDLRKLNEGNQTMADRKTVESMLMQQKFEQELQNWVSQLRSQAFVVTS